MGEPVAVSKPDKPPKLRREHAPVWDRIKILLFLGLVAGFFTWQDVNPPFVSWGEAFGDFAASTFGIVVLVLVGLEVLRQIHYVVSEFSAGYNHVWQERIFKGTERQVHRRMRDWTRFRIRRVITWLILLTIYGLMATVLLDYVNSPAEAITKFPEVLGQVVPIVMRFAFFGGIVMFQFVAIFWFLSRGGIDTVFPQDIETRFDDVWGQDHVLDLVIENIAFLERPDEIEEKGGYIPGGILLWGPPGTGKGQPVSAELMTPTGPRLMGEVLPGDEVIGSDGTSTRISEVHLLGERDIFRVHFSDGTSLRVTEDHLWDVTSRYGGRRVIETKGLVGRLQESDGHYRYRIPIVESVEFEERPLPLDPYVMGALLGDGSFRHQLKLSTRDPEILGRVEAGLPAGDSLVHHKGYDYSLIGGSTRTIAKELGLFGLYSHEKFVPEDYLWNSAANRLALLQGLMDTDGSVDQRGGVTFSSTSPSLIAAVTFLVQSFGGTTSVRERTTRYTHDGETREGRTSWELRVVLDNDVKAFSLPRKVSRVTPRTKYFPVRLITDIVPDGREEARCIRVEADDHLYATEHFIVTHNTLMAEAIAGEVGKPYVFVDPGAFIQMFMGVGILKVKRLFRKLRKLSLQHGGVVVFFDEADSLGSRGSQVQGGQGPFQPMQALSERFSDTCNGYTYLSDGTRRRLLDEMMDQVSPSQPSERDRLVDRIMMGGMGGGGMGTLQALLTEISGLKKPRGLSNRMRRIMGIKPKPPPQYRILIMMATNMPNSLDQAMLRPGRIDRIYKVGYPSMEGRKQTLDGYLAKVKHTLSEEDVDKLAVRTPYYSGAKIKDLVNEALILAIRDDRDTVTWDDVWRAKALKEHGPPDDFEYIQRERHAVAIHEASHAVVAHLLRRTATIDVATIERRGEVGGFVSSLPVEDRFTQWRTEIETDVKVALASLVGEKMFFEGDNSSGVGNDLQKATQMVSLMEGVWGMGGGITSLSGIPQSIAWQTPDPSEKVVGTMPNRIESSLKRLFDETWVLIDDNREKVLAVAAALEEHKTISGDQVGEIIGIEAGEAATDATGFHSIEVEEEELEPEGVTVDQTVEAPTDGKRDEPVEVEAEAD